MQFNIDQPFAPSTAVRITDEFLFTDRPETCESDRRKSEYFSYR